MSSSISLSESIGGGIQVVGPNTSFFVLLLMGSLDVWAAGGILFMVFRCMYVCVLRSRLSFSIVGIVCLVGYAVGVGTNFRPLRRIFAKSRWISPSLRLMIDLGRSVFLM